MPNYLKMAILQNCEIYS